MTKIPKTQYAGLGEDRIAYQVFGEGEVDLLWVPASGDCIDTRWEWALYVEFLQWLGTKARVISFDRRGAGASDDPSGEHLPLWEQWSDDALAVLDAVGSERAVVCGGADSGPAAILFAASHPERTRGLIAYNTWARAVAAPDYPAGIPSDALLLMTQFVQETWGTEQIAEFGFPDLNGRDPFFAAFWAKGMRTYMSPGKASRVMYSEQTLDVREALALVRVPTLVLHREEIQFIPVEHGRYLAEHIAGAQLAIVPGRDGFIFTEPGAAETLNHIDKFLSGLTRVLEPDRALAAILFTDIVGSTERASALGDREWRQLLETHDAVARTIVEQHKGRLVQHTGDGMLATFDGPGRAIRGATALGDALQPLGLEIRAGIHTGEVEIREDSIAGIAVHIAARVQAAASPGELWVSPAVPMLVAGSGIEFDDRGEHVLKGVPGTWRLFAVRG